MAHASSLEAAKNRDKRRRKQRAKAKAEWNALSEEEKTEIEEKRYAEDLKQMAAAVMYDMEINHITPVRSKDILTRRLKEIEQEIFENPAIEQCRSQEKQKIEVKLNDILK